MVPSYCAIGIFFGIFWGVCVLCLRSGRLSFSRAELLVFYLFSRIVPVFMQEHIAARSLLCLLLEWILIGVLTAVCRKREAAGRRMLAFYLFQPASIFCILEGMVSGLYLVFLFFMVVLALEHLIRPHGGRLLSFWPEYLSGCIGIYCTGWSVLLFHGRASLLSGVGNVLLAGSVLHVLYRVWKRDWNLSRPVSKGERSVEVPAPPSHFRTHDVVLMLLLTFIFGAIVLFRLGSTQAPETFRSMTAEESDQNQIVLKFKENTNISKIYLFLGYQSNRCFSFSCIQPGENTWTVFDSSRVLRSAFCWNAVEVNRELSSLGLVLMKEDAAVGEIVCLDSSGQRILPENASAYPELFDEQESFPGIPSAYDQTIFDEVYHGRTAYEFLHGLPIYETTHPPLGKIIIAAGIRLFGMNPFGWRISCAVLGILMIPLFYLLAFQLFRRTGPTVFAVLLLETSFMNYTLSRIATIDILVAFFVLCMFFFMLCFLQSLEKQESQGRQFLWLFLCGCSTAFAISVKWTGFYAAAGIAILFFEALFREMRGIRSRRYAWHHVMLPMVLWCCLCFLLIPGLVYLLSYIPFQRLYPEQNVVMLAMENARSMFSYHVATVAEHPYASEWYQWLVDWRPLLDSYTAFPDGRTGTVSTFLNPLLCWGGLPALFHQFYLWKERRDRNALFLIVCYGAMVLPWLFIHRTVFIYQYFIGGCLLPLMFANSCLQFRQSRALMAGLSVASLLLFLAFFPVLSGLPVSPAYVRTFLTWLPSWIFV